MLAEIVPGAAPRAGSGSSRSRCSCSRSSFAAGALAHPRVRLSQPDQNATIVLLVDVSGSMRANDVEPTRLDAAVAAMRTFLDRLPKQFKVGLVAFSSEPEPLIAPDVRTATRSGSRSRCSSRRPGRRSATGSRVAVQMLNSSLKQAGYVRKPGQPVPGAIVLLSDGAQNRGILQPLQAARMAKEAGIRIYPVSLGTPQRQGDVRLRRVHELGAGAARPGHDEPDRDRHRRPGLHRRDRLERRADLQDARLEHRPHAQAHRDHLWFASPPRRSCSAAVGAARSSRAALP